MEISFGAKGLGVSTSSFLSREAKIAIFEVEVPLQHMALWLSPVGGDVHNLHKSSDKELTCPILRLGCT